MTEVNQEKSSAKGKQLAVAEPASVVRDAPNADNNPYPPPLAKYEEVVTSPKLFMETLEKLHTTLGTKFMVPTIGGKELDLHRLFVEVTSRGGIEKKYSGLHFQWENSFVIMFLALWWLLIIRERRWKDVTAVFSFPSTATNASFVLRKYYLSLMHHYEQIYFFGAQGWNSPPTVEKAVEAMLPSSETQASTQKRRRSTASLPLPTNCPVVGVIDGKFEHGYLVTVTVGTEKLKGVLYHTPECTSAQMQQTMGITNNSNVSGVRQRRRRRKLSKRDPTHPKPNRSGYNFFFAEQHARLKALHPDKDREISKMIGDLWNKLTETEKEVYQVKGVKDKERYRSEMEEYRERQKTGQVIRDAVPIQQLPAEPETTMADMESKIETGMEFKIETEEGDLPLTGNNSSGSDSEDEKLEKDSELVSPGAGAGAESTELVDEHLTEGEGFELRRRHHVQMEDGHEVDGSIEVSDLKEVGS